MLVVEQRRTPCVTLEEARQGPELKLKILEE
jgi:hypothetical protein